MTRGPSNKAAKDGKEVSILFVAVAKRERGQWIDSRVKVNTDRKLGLARVPALILSLVALSMLIWLLLLRDEAALLDSARLGLHRPAQMNLKYSACSPSCVGLLRCAPANERRLQMLEASMS